MLLKLLNYIAACVMFAAGERQRWRNSQNEPGVLVVVLIGAHHDNVPGR